MNGAKSIILYSILFFANVSWGVRILDGAYDQQTHQIVLNVAFQGHCSQDPIFDLQWSLCAKDEQTQDVFQYGFLLIKNEPANCVANEEKIISFKTTFKVCQPNKFYIKATSSKIPFLIQR